MTATRPAPPLVDALARLLRDGAAPWSGLGVTPDELVETCRREDLVGLVHEALDAWAGADWPAAVREALGREARALAALELVRRRAVSEALEALERGGVQPILLKGTALAYAVYAAPHLRPRDDTDLLIRPGEAGAARAALEALGYASPAYCEDVFGQFPLERRDALGVVHALDVHVRLSAHAAFAGLPTWEELRREAVPVNSLGAHARGAGAVHALLLACVHPAMHHRNAERLLWVYDVHLLAGRLGEAERARFVELARDRGVAAICARELERAAARFGTVVAEATVRRLRSAGAEPAASWLAPRRTWSDELAANLRGLPTWRQRWSLVRAVALPSPSYMLRSYGVSRRIGAALLPALYVHRAVRGLWRVVTGRK